MYAAVCGSIYLWVIGQICEVTPLYVVSLAYIATQSVLFIVRRCFLLTFSTFFWHASFHTVNVSRETLVLLYLLHATCYVLLRAPARNRTWI